MGSGRLVAIASKTLIAAAAFPPRNAHALGLARSHTRSFNRSRTQHALHPRGAATYTHTHTLQSPPPPQPTQKYEHTRQTPRA